jgi:IS1 family transposase/transposase-like protein
MNSGNVSAISTYMTASGKRRIFRCRECTQTFSETRETVFFDLRTPEEKVMMALKMLLVRVDLTGIAFVLGVTEESVLEWLERAAAKADEINRHLLRDLPVTHVQLDEMWNFIRRKHAEEADSAGESLPEGEDGRQWIYVAFAPEFRLMIAAEVGARTLETTKRVIASTAERVRGIPAFFSDGYTCYLTALIAFYHTIVTFPRTGKRGRPKGPKAVPHDELVYAQLIKEKKQGRLHTLSTRVLLGATRLTELGLSISTALVERVNLTMRQALAPLVRKTTSFCKQREPMRQRVTFFHAFYNFARPHQSLRTPLPVHLRRRTGAVRPRWRHRTPAMAAGLTDHIWTFRELLMAKFELLDSQSISG